jgi:hypothetical protein
MSDLRPIHTDTNIDPNNQGKVIAGAIVIVAILGIGVFGYQAGWFHGQHLAVPDNRLPQASMPLTGSAKG